MFMITKGSEYKFLNNLMYIYIIAEILKYS